MPISHPPRREPRVLAAEQIRGGLAFAAVDPWQIRSTGVSRLRPGNEQGALRRLLAREKPTAVILGRALRPSVDPLDLRLPSLPLPKSLPSAALAAELFPELATYAPTPALRRVVLLAIAAVLQGNIPSRTYATSRS